jgi:hypothetical protein
MSVIQIPVNRGTSLIRSTMIDFAIYAAVGIVAGLLYIGAAWFYSYVWPALPIAVAEEMADIPPPPTQATIPNDPPPIKSIPPQDDDPAAKIVGASNQDGNRAVPGTQAAGLTWSFSRDNLLNDKVVSTSLISPKPITSDQRPLSTFAWQTPPSCKFAEIFKDGEKIGETVLLHSAALESFSQLSGLKNLSTPTVAGQAPDKAAQRDRKSAGQLPAKPRMVIQEVYRDEYATMYAEPVISPAINKPWGAIYFPGSSYLRNTSVR